MATGIKDRVAIIGMGCCRFGERWDAGAEDLMVEAFEEALQDAKIEKNQIDAAWFSTCMPEIHTGQSALPCSMTLRLSNIPVTRVENYCASGTEALRGATYAVASGASDIALANVNAFCETAITMTNLNSLLPIYGSTEEASHRVTAP